MARRIRTASNPPCPSELLHNPRTLTPYAGARGGLVLGDGIH
jgi:hypothetical protein